MAAASDSAKRGAPTTASRLWRLVTWVIAIGCFYLVYGRIAGAAARDGISARDYLAHFFGGVDWVAWLSLMVPYSLLFFVIDAHATWRVIRWFNAPQIRFMNVLPIRASAYILSLVNEQVGKGAMSLYLLRRYRVPGWEAVSTMILLGVMEIYQLLIFSAIGVALYSGLVDQASTILSLNRILPAVFAIAALYVPFHLAYFSGRILPRSTLRDRPLLRAFRLAKPRHYVLVLLFKAPNLLVAVLVYTASLKLFNVDVGFGQMLAFLPVIFLAAALPLPFHAGALLLWTVLFPEYPEVGAFSLVMHTSFVLLNALIGVAFLPLANRELFVETPLDDASAAAADPP